MDAQVHTMTKPPPTISTSIARIAGTRCGTVYAGPIRKATQMTAEVITIVITIMTTPATVATLSLTLVLADPQCPTGQMSVTVQVTSSGRSEPALLLRSAARIHPIRIES